MSTTVLLLSYFLVAQNYSFPRIGYFFYYLQVCIGIHSSFSQDFELQLPQETEFSFTLGLLYMLYVKFIQEKKVNRFMENSITVLCLQGAQIWMKSIKHNIDYMLCLHSGGSQVKFSLGTTCPDWHYLLLSLVPPFKYQETNWHTLTGVRFTLLRRQFYGCQKMLVKIRYLCISFVLDFEVLLFKHLNYF
jgi:hypothetical protein